LTEIEPTGGRPIFFLVPESLDDAMAFGYQKVSFAAMAKRPAGGAGTPAVGPDHQTYGAGSMADLDVTAIPLELPKPEAAALAQFVKRVDYGTCCKFASPTATYDGRHECDVMWSGICILQRQLAEAGFAPR
jgi:hypothetical protein